MMRSSKDEELGDRDMDVFHSERSLQSIPPTYSPSLVFIHGKEYCDQTFATLTDEHHHIRRIPEMRQMRCIASSYGWLIMHNRTDSSQYYLFNPISLKKLHLPPLRHSNFVVGALTSSPIDNNCLVLLASTKRNSFVRCQIGDEQWIEKDLGPKTKRKSYKRYLFTRILSCGENIYLFCEDGMFVIDVLNMSTKFHKRIWSEVTSKHSDSVYIKCVSFKHFFVESCGDIFHVMLTYAKIGDRGLFQKLDYVFRLEVSEMAWVQVKSLDDRIFLLGATSSVSFSSTEFGMKGNCIYFCTTNKYTKVWIDDMDDRSQTDTLPCPKHLSCLDGPFWVLPNCKLQMKKDAAKLEEVEYVQDDERNLPTELLEIILSGPFLGDCIRFRLICKSRIPVMPPFRPYTSLKQTKSRCNQLPWLLSLPKNKKGLCNLYHPVYSDAYTLNIPHEFAGAVVRCAKYGWLLMSQGGNSVFFFNPSSKETIQLPELFNRRYEFVNITFSSTPTSPDCIVFVYINIGIIDIYRRVAKEDSWLGNRIKNFNGSKFSPVLSSPVFCDGVFYSLGKEGKLGILNPNDQDLNTMFKIIPNAFPGKVGSSSSETRSFKRFLMVYDGEILSVIAGHSSAKPVWVYKFDRSKMEWIKLESLGDKVIFLSHTGSIVVPAGLKGVENRIYFPRFQGRDIVYYSLSTGTYHCFGETVAAEDWINTYQDLNCTWFHPIQYREDRTKRDAEPRRQDQKRCSGFWGYYKCLILCFFAAIAIIASSYC